MSQILGGQHKVEETQKHILNNGDKYFNAQRQVLNEKENKDLIKNVQNGNVNKQNVDVHKMFGDNDTFLDFDRITGKGNLYPTDDEILERNRLGNAGYKERSSQLNQQECDRLRKKQNR